MAWEDKKMEIRTNKVMDRGERRYVSHLDVFPSHEHFAVLVEESMRYDDGYGTQGSPSYSTHNYLQYIAFKDEDALKEWILQHEARPPFKQYSVIRASSVKVVKEVLIKVES